MRTDQEYRNLEAENTSLRERLEKAEKDAAFWLDALKEVRKTLEIAQRSNDFVTIRNLAHSIKGSAGVFNAAATLAAAQLVETAGKDGDAAAVRREIPVLLTELGNLAGVLRRARRAP